MQQKAAVNSLSRRIFILTLAAAFTASVLLALPKPVKAGFTMSEAQTYTLNGETYCQFYKDTEKSRIEVPLILNRLHEGFGPYVEVTLLAITPKPTSIISDNNGNMRAVYIDFHTKGNLRVRQTALVKTRQVDFTPNKPYVSDGSFAKYLQPSALVESDNPIIQAKAAQVTAGITDPYEKARAVFAFVQNHMTFDDSDRYAHKGALSALKTGRGTCDEHATLMVALLRASGIPARDMGGYAIDYSTQAQSRGVNLRDTARHAWVEFYLKGEGWIPADPITRRIKGDSYPKWSNFGSLNPNWVYIPDSIGSTKTWSYTYTGLRAPKIQDELTIRAGTYAPGGNWYQVMSGSGNSLYPAPVYLPWQTVQVVLNGEAKVFAPPVVIKEGTALLPFRALFEALGARVNYNSADKRVTGYREGTNIVLRLGSGTAVVNGKTVYLSKTPEIISGSLYVPTRFVAENLGGRVTWDKEAREIRIDMPVAH